MRSSVSSGSSIARRSRSHPAFSAILLSASRSARFFASLKPLDPDGGYFLETAEFRGLNTTVPGKRRRGFVDDHRHGETKITYAVGDLADLFLRMRTRVTRVGLDRVKATNSILCMSTSVSRPGRGAQRVGQNSECLRNSGSDHVELGRVASLAVLRRHWRLGRLSAGFAEHHPASIACRPDVGPVDLATLSLGGSRALLCNPNPQPTLNIDKNCNSRQPVAKAACGIVHCTRHHQRDANRRPYPLDGGRR